MCIQTVCKEFPEKEQKPIDGKSAYAKWISESGFDQISYNPGGEVTPICDLCGANKYCIELRSEVKK